MFRPNKNIQVGGDYTNTSNLLDSTNLYGVLSQDNSQLLQVAIDTPTRISTLTGHYQSTVSSISTTLSALQSESTRLNYLHDSSIIAKQEAYDNYSISNDILSTYSSAYIYSSILCSTYINTLNSVSSYVSTSTGMLIELSTCTWFSTCELIQSGGQRSRNRGPRSAQSTFDYLVPLSTIHGNIINQQISTIYNVTIPNLKLMLSTYSTHYISALRNYNSVETDIFQQFSTYGFLTSSISTQNGRITILEEKINENNQTYVSADRRIKDDDAMIIYKNALKSDTETYIKYNSTIVTMRQIENVYNLVMNGLSVPTELLNAMPMQGGGEYTQSYRPTYIISSFTCDTSNSVCNAKLSQLNTYITAYYSLSTALLTYAENYETAHQARINAEVNTTLRLSTNLQDTLDNLYERLKTAENDIQTYTGLLQTERAELSRLYGISSGSTVDLASSLFTTDELADLASYGNSVQIGGSVESGGTPIRHIRVQLDPYRDTTISYHYSTQRNIHDALVKNDNETYASLQNNYISSLAVYQLEVNNILKRDTTYTNIETERGFLQERLDSNIEALSSIYRRISSVSTAIKKNNINNIMASDATTEQNDQRRNTLTSYQKSTIQINQLLSTYYNNEINFYMNTLSQISSYITYDSALQESNIYTTPPVDDNTKSTIYFKIDKLTEFLVKTESYMGSIMNEQYYKKIYLDTKNIYEIEEGILANGTDRVNSLPKDMLDRIAINYDIYVSEINNIVNTRKILNNTYISTISTMLEYLTPGTHNDLYSPKINSPNTSSVTLLPYRMNFEYVSTRKSLFNKADIIPQSLIPTCPPANFIDQTPQTTTTIITPTTTLNTTIYGKQGRYVKITKADNNFEILQVIVINSKGKNVAFQKPVEITPVLMASNRAQYITNGRYNTNSNFQPPVGIIGSGGYIAMPGRLPTAFGTITCDPITKQIYVFNLQTRIIEKVSSDLKTFTNLTASVTCTNCVNACISAYNENVYVIDSNTQSFFSVNSSGQKTNIQSNFNFSGPDYNINNPTSISNVHNNLIYITNNTNWHNVKTIISYNIVNGNNTTNVIAKSGGLDWGATMDISIISNIGGIVVSSNGIIYVVDNGLRIISLTLSTNTVSVLAGSTIGGYKDDIGTNALFNGINGICIDSENNLFVTDSLNNAIRKIDTLSGNVTTYITANYSATNTVYTNYPSIVPNAIARIYNTAPSHTSYLYSICFSGSNIYTSSYNNSNGHSLLYPYAKNGTINTWITSLPYSSYGGAPLSSSFFSSTESSSTPVQITIDLGAVVDITAIRYLKNSTSYSPVGLTFSILDSDKTVVTTLPPISVNLGVVNFDLRKTDLSQSDSRNAALTLISTRDGICGPLGRYIKLSSSGNYYFAISEISIITTDGSNLGIGAKIFATMGNTNVSARASLLINGTYNSLPEENSFVYSSTSTSDYIIIDLGAEYDISAINLYYARETPTSKTIQNTATISILTADMQVALTRQTSQYHTTILKEILDFRSNNSCPISIKWPSFYGTAGIIARYIRLNKAGQMAFSKLEVVDRTGLDVAQFLRPNVASGSTTALNALTNISAPRLKNLGYLSDTNSNQYFIVDLQQPREITAINLYGCIDADLMSGLTISIYSNDPTISTNLPLIVYSAVSGVQIQRFDTRYEPSVSNYPTTVTRSVSKYGSFGVYADKVFIYTNTLYTLNTKIIDAAGILISVPAQNAMTHPLVNGKYKFSYTLPRMYEITSVLINAISPEIMVELYDCYNMLVASSLTTELVANSFPPPLLDSGVTSRTAMINTLYPGHSFADFRNFLNNQRNPYAPIVPWPLRRGGYRLGANGSLGLSNPYTNSGVKARYVQIIPRDPQTPLYISQILAVDEFGINRAFQKQTFYMNMTNRGASPINFPNDGKNAVDGVYEAQIDNIEFLQLFFTKYKRKQIEQSYKSYVDPVGTALPNSYAFFIDLELDQTTDPAMMDPNNRKEYSINSIIYVASDERGSESEDVIIQLLDDNLNVVGSQKVTRMARVFGLDILDFRPDIAVSMNSIPNRVEVRERIVSPGPEGQGVLTQYIRVEQTHGTHPIKLSHIIATDTTSYNIAMFKPTYSSSNNMSSFLIVDGTSYIKNPTNAFTTASSSGEYQFIEVNLEKEYELINLKIGDVFGSSEGFSTLRVRLYNKDRDIIGSHAKFVPASIKASLGYTGTNSPVIEDTRLDTNNFMYLNKIGVSIADNLTAYKARTGLIATASVSSFSTINIMPSLLDPLSGPAPTTTNNMIITQRYTRENGGVPCQYVRLYNVGQYIQVSQLMVYDTTGTNVAYKKPAYATSILPNNYAAYATDGYGGFFHTARDEQNCFISGNRRYDYLEIDLVNTFNIIAVRYIPPTTNLGRNLGVRIQLLDSNRNHLIEKVVTTHGDVILDYRIPNASNPSIYHMISPKIYKVTNLLYETDTITGFFVRPYSIGDPLVSVLSFVYASSSNTSIQAIRVINNMPVKISLNTELYFSGSLSNIMGIHCSASGVIYIAEYNNNRIRDISTNNQDNFLVGWHTDDGVLVDSGTIINPYSLVKIGNMLYISENRIGGKIYVYNNTYRVGTLSSAIYTNDYIGSMVEDWNGNLLVCVGSTKEVVRITLGTNIASVVAGPIGSSALCILPLQFPSGIAVDKTNKIIFVSDILTNQIYAIRENSSIGTLIAGTGIAGNSGDGAQGTYARINGPFFLQYYEPDKCLYFADKNNKTIRKIDMESKPTETISTTTIPYITTTNQPVFTTTTIPSSGSSVLTQTALIIRPTTNDTYVSVINKPTARGFKHINGVFQSNSQAYCFTTPFNNYLFYYFSGNLYRINTSENTATDTLVGTHNIGDILSTTTDRLQNLYLLTDKKTLFRNGTDISYTRRIYKNGIGNLANEPTPYCGTGVEGYSPDGTVALLANIMPVGITYNNLTNELYFTDCQPACGIIRKINSLNTLETIVGLYNLNRIAINPSNYYNFIEDTVRPEANPLAINLLNPVAILTDNNGYTYIADSDTCCIHRLTPHGTLQPVCGPFRNTPTPIEYLNTYAIDIDYPAYNVKIKTINSLTFDGNMNLICTSLNGCQIICISNLDGIEPNVRVICGIGVNVDNLKPYSAQQQISKYFNVRSPRSICYSFNSNALYCVNFGDYNNDYICIINQTYNSIIYNGENRIIPYGTANILINPSDSTTKMCIDMDGNIYYTDLIVNNNKIKKYLANGTTSDFVTSNNFTPGDLCIYNNTDVYYINTFNNSINKCNINTQVSNQYFLDTETPNYIDIFENGYIILSYTNSIKVLNINDYVSMLTTRLSGSNYGPICINKTTNKLYISTNTNNTITITEYTPTFNYNPSPTTLITIRPDSITGFTMTGPLTNIICDTAGNIYISNSTTVYLINRDQTIVASYLQGFSNPKSMSWHNNNLYVADTGNNRIRRIPTTGSNLNSVELLPSPVPNFSSPSGVFADSTHVYIADSGNNRICKYDINSMTYTYFTTDFANGNSRVNIRPIGIVADSNTIFYTGIEAAYGGMNERYGLYSYGTKNTGLANVEYSLGQLTLDNSTNTLYTIDTTGKIINFTKNGSIIQNISQTPAILAYTKYNNTYHYISSLSFYYSFTFINTITLVASNTPWSITIQNSTLSTKYITANKDAIYCIANNSVYKLISNGVVRKITGLHKVVSSPIPTTIELTNSFLPTSPMTINLTTPSCIKITESGSIYTADSNRIIKIDNQQIVNNQYIYSIAGDTKFDGNSGDDILGSSALLNTPTGTCFDSRGNIYIGDKGNNCVRRIDVITGIITTVATNIPNIVDVKIDGTGALYILTTEKLYRSTVNTLTTFNTPVLIAGGGSSFLDSGNAINSTIVSSNGRTDNLPTARSMCIDKFGNIYIASSVQITKLLSETIVSRNNTISTTNFNLYGISSSTEISVPNPPINGSSYKADYDAQVSLYGMNGSIPATHLDPKNPGLAYIENIKRNNIITKETENSVIQNMYNYINSWQSKFINIYFYFRAAKTARDSGDRNSNNYPAVGRAGFTRLVNELLPNQITDFTTYINSNYSIYDDVVIINRRMQASLTHAKGVVEYVTQANESAIFLKINEFDAHYETYIVPSTGDNGIFSKALNHSQNATAAYNTALTEYYGSTNRSQILSPGALYNYNQGMIARYGQTTYISNPTAGTLFNYNRDYNLLQVAIAQSPVGVAESQAIGHVVKIDIYGIIRIYEDRLKECTGITCDTAGNVYIVDHYSNIIYKLPASWNKSGNLDHIINTLENKPYGIGLDNNNNLWISCNSANLSNLTPNVQGHKILKYNYNAGNNRYDLHNANQIGTGSPALEPYTNYYGNVINPSIKNPALLAIDRSNRLIFTQTDLHSVLLTVLSAPLTTVNNIKSIRIEPAGIGRRVCLNTIDISPSNSQRTITTNGTATALPYSSNVNDINAFINFSFETPISFNSLSLTANPLDTDAVGMKVLLFDSSGTLISNRVTTTDILTSTGCKIYYDTVTVSKS